MKRIGWRAVSFFRGTHLSIEPDHRQQADENDAKRRDGRLGDLRLIDKVVSLCREGLKIGWPEDQREWQFLHCVDEYEQPGGDE